MSAYHLKMKLISDATFGRGDGVAGIIDREVEHDPSGFPYLRGRTLKGLLSEEADNLVTLIPSTQRLRWQSVAHSLFGVPGSTLETMAIMYVSDACLPSDLRNAVTIQLQDDKQQLTRSDILASLSTIRRQTAIDSTTGIPIKGSLRTTRVVLRELVFSASLIFHQTPSEDMLALLAASTLALRRVGSRRNRGGGRVQCSLWNSEGQDISPQYFERFGREIQL